MSLVTCAACRRHHAPGGACPFCAAEPDRAAEPLATSLGGALLLSAVTTLGCVGAPTPTPRPPGVPEAARLIDSLPTPTPGPTPTPTPATTYGMPPPRKRRRAD